MSRVGPLSRGAREKHPVRGHRDKLQRTSSGPRMPVDIVSEHQDCTLRDGRCSCRERVGCLPQDNQGSSAKPLLHLRASMQGASSSQLGERGGERKVWGRTSNLLRIGGLALSSSTTWLQRQHVKGRGYARVSETPGCCVPRRAEHPCAGCHEPRA